MGNVVVGIDVGTTKICTIVGEVRADDLYVIGVGVEPSRGMKKGVVMDVNALINAVSASVHKAERNSRYQINRAFVSVASGNIDARNSKGVVGISSKNGVQITDLERAIDAARAIPLPHNREILHVIPRSYTLDGQEGVRSPLGMHGFRLEVETHIIMASTSGLQNIEKCVHAAGVTVDRFILNPLASADVVLAPSEREMGSVVVDIGGGTTDIAIFQNGSVWHTAVIPVGGWHLTNDIAVRFHLPYETAEGVKLEYGNADPNAIDPEEQFLVPQFGEDTMVQVSRRELAETIYYRVEELFELIAEEIKRSGVGVIPAGAILTGGSSQLPGMKTIAANVLKLPARLAQPEKISGMSDQLLHPSYSTSVGLLRLGLIMDQEDARRGVALETEYPANGNNPNRGRRPNPMVRRIGEMLRRLLPEDNP
jgi:cell division protein FtsA